MNPAALLLLATLLSAPAPAVPRPAPPPVPGVRVATDGPPPALLADPRGEAPSPDAVWIDGYWQWAAGQWAWVRGEWAVPPGKPPCTWVPARWTSDARGQVFHEPFWSPPDGAPRRVHEPTWVPHVSSPSAPPPLLVETPEPAPARDAVWIPGFWAWTGSRYAWVAGNWSLPVPGRTWQEGHWRRAGTIFGWVPGRWRGR